MPLRVWIQKALSLAWLPALVGSVLAADSSPPRVPSPSAVAVLTNAAQVIKLSKEQAKAGLPVSIRGVVTCYRHGVVLFVEDETAGLFVYHTGDRLPLRANQGVQVTGRTSPGRYSPIVVPEVIQPMAKGQAIAAKSVSLAEINYGGLDAQSVEVTGVICSQKSNDQGVELQLAAPPHRIKVWILDCPGSAQLPPAGSLVRVRGVVAACTGERGEVDSFQLIANTPADISVDQVAQADPFESALVSIHDLETSQVRTRFWNQVRVQGVVTLHWPGRALFIQDATGGLEVKTEQPLVGLLPGAAVDVVGLLGPVLEAPRLEEATVRRLGQKPPPEAIRVRAEELFKGRHQGQLVAVDCTVLGVTDSTTNGVVLALEAAGSWFAARLEAAHSREELNAVQPGCRVRASGVCRSETRVKAEPAVSLLLRSPADLQVLSPALLKNEISSEMMAGAAIAAVLGLAVAVWAARQSRRTSQILQAEAVLRKELRQGQEQLRRSLEERERIGRDLHDEIIQSIYGVGLGLEDCRRVIRQAPEKAEARLATAVETLNNAIRTIRGFIAGLEPKVLNGGEFKTALRSLALTSGDGPSQFQINVDTATANRLTSAQATQLLHIAKEAMSNCLRHADTSHIVVSLRPQAADIVLEVRDDGAGFNPETVNSTGHGLRNMAARAREIGAELQIISAPGQGCRIVLTIPQRDSHEPD